MDPVALGRKAFDYLIAQGVKHVCPGFSLGTVLIASKMKVTVSPWMREFFGNDDVDEQQIVETFATFGHKVSKTAWQLQEHLEEKEMRLFQTNLNYVPQDFPKPDEPVHVTGFANKSSLGSHYLSFKIVTFDETGEEILIGAGHSTLSPIHLNVPPAITPQVPQTVGTSSVPTPTTPNDVPTSPSTPSRLHTDSGSVTVDEVVRPAANSIRSESPPRDLAASSATPAALQPADPASTAAAPSPIPLPSILRRRRADAPSLGKRKRHVSFGTNDDKREERFMMLNVETPHPSRMEKLNDVLGRIGVKPVHITYHPFPIKNRNRHVFCFDVISDQMISRVENLMQPRNWSYRFGIRTLSLEDQQPVIAKALSMPDIIETLFLSQMVGRKFNRNPSSFVLKDDLQDQLADKTYLGNVLKDQSMTSEVLQGLNKEGRRIFNRIVKPRAIL